MNENYIVKGRLRDHINMFNKMSEDDVLLQQINDIAGLISDVMRKGGRLLLCGNGGSASDAQHIAAEFVGRFQKERKAYDAEALNINTSIITAVANDYTFEDIYTRQVEAKGRIGDILIGISTSGKSVNIVNALKRANEMEMTTIMLTGDYNGLEVEEFCDYVVKVPERITARVQEGHIFVGHVIAELVEKMMEG